jgi:CelD/BcsL family acetyltransferase involved in cellulose biosynthesis
VIKQHETYAELKHGTMGGNWVQKLLLSTRRRPRIRKLRPLVLRASQATPLDAPKDFNQFLSHSHYGWR